MDNRRGVVHPHEWGACTAAALLALAIALWIYQPWQGSFAVPFDYGESGDAQYEAMLVKSIVDHGWVINPSLGRPGPPSMQGLPQDGGGLRPGIMKGLSLFITDWGVLLNSFFLLTFPLTAMLCFWTMRRLRISRVSAVLASVLYALLPYHFARGESHLELAMYFLVPPMALVVLWITAPPRISIDGRTAESSALNLRSRDTLVAFVITTLVASAAIYYAFFAVCFLLSAGALASIRQANWRPVVLAGLFAAWIGLVGGINQAPVIAHQMAEGAGSGLAERTPVAAEVNGLKIDQLFMPIDGHRIPMFAEFKAAYHRSLAAISPALDNEAIDSSPLGALGALGFLLVLIWPFMGARGSRWVGADRHDILTRVGELQILGVLIGTVGGFGALVALALPAIRSYNRLVVYLAFFSLSGLAILADHVLDGARVGRRRQLTTAAIAFLFVLAVLDQTTPWTMPSFVTTGAAFESDAELVARMEKALPSGASVFQLPYMAFPEPARIERMAAYEPLRAYLHSSVLCWSYGAHRDGEADIWQQGVAELPLHEMLAELRRLGFAAIWLDRNGYADNGQQIETLLRAETGVEPLLSKNGQISVFLLGNGESKAWTEAAQFDCGGS